MVEQAGRYTPGPGEITPQNEIPGTVPAGTTRLAGMMGLTPRLGEPQVTLVLLVENWPSVHVCDLFILKQVLLA